MSHRSWCAENDQPESNERLEFLGDAVLGLIIAGEIFQRYPELPEGELAKLRAGVVNGSTLAEVARTIDVGSRLRLGKGERATGGADKQSILADALEAIIGAVYIDGGFDAARRLVLRLWSDAIFDARRDGPGISDHKTRVFTARVVIGDEVLGTGSGSSKKEAEQAAAGQAVATLKRAMLDNHPADNDSERRAS